MRKCKNVITDFCEYASVYEGSYLFRFWSAVAVVSAALERRVWMPIGESELFPNVYIFLIGDAGTRKSFTAGLATGMLKRVSGIHYIQDRLTPAVLVKALKEGERSFQIANKIYTQSAAFSYASELRVLLEDIGGGSLISLLTDFFDSRRHGDRFTSRTMKGGTIEIIGPALTLLACSTPDWFMEVLPNYAIGGGFTSRVIFVVQTTGLDRPIAEPIIPDPEFRNALIETVSHIHDKISGPYEMTPRARKEFVHWYENFMPYASKNIPDERFKGYAMRKGDFVRKLAMIFSAAQRDERVVDEFDIVLAIEALNAIEPAMMAAFGPVGDSPNARNIARLFYRIPEGPEEIAHSTLLRSLWYHIADAKTFIAHLEVMTQMGAITSRVTETTHKIFYSRVPGFDLNSAVKNLNKIEPRIYGQRQSALEASLNNGNGETSPESPPEPETSPFQEPPEKERILSHA